MKEEAAVLGFPVSNSPQVSVDVSNVEFKL